MIRSAWEHHARARVAAGDLLHPPGPTGFSWTRSGENDPGVGLLGEVTGRRVVELGCGTGNNLAHLVDHHGARGVGVDSAPTQIVRARARWPHLDLRKMGAARFLVGEAGPFDVCYSVFGAVGLTRPTLPLLALIRRRLVRGGLLAFSVPAGTRSLPVDEPGQRVRWYLHSQDEWSRKLLRGGFQDIEIRSADLRMTPGTLILTALA